MPPASSSALSKVFTPSIWPMRYMLLAAAV